MQPSAARQKSCPETARQQHPAQALEQACQSSWQGFEPFPDIDDQLLELQEQEAPPAIATRSARAAARKGRAAPHASPPDSLTPPSISRRGAKEDMQKRRRSGCPGMQFSELFRTAQYLISLERKHFCYILFHFQKKSSC